MNESPTTAADDLEDARASQAALAADPDNPVLLLRLGRVMGRLGQRDLELALIGQAVARAPEDGEGHVALGASLLACGFPADARESFEAAILLGNGHDGARARLADLELDAGNVAAARALLDPPPEDPAADRALGRLALHDENWEEASRRLLAHLQRNPLDPNGLFFLGVALQARDMLEPAVASYQQAITLDPGLFEAHANLSTVLLALGQPELALVHAERAAQLEPNRPGVYLNLSNARRDVGDTLGAASELQRAIDLEPRYAEAWSSLGNLYLDMGELGLSLAAHQQAVTLAPSLAQAHWNRSFALLTAGQLELGWSEYEYRAATKAARPEPRDFPWPLLDSRPEAGARLLVYREQGIGDELLFLTCIPDLIATGAAITLLVSPRLESIVRRSYPGIDVRADLAGAVDSTDRFDRRIPLGSLPRWLRATRAAFPATAPCLVPDPQLVARWSERLAALGPGRRVGWCWRSGLVTAERRRHYAPLEAYRPLLATPGLRWVNLQYDDCDAELVSIEREWGVTIHRWPELDLRNDLENVLALTSCLDAVVTAATATSSIAGSVGCPTWQIDTGSDWTALGEERSPWFPSIQLAKRGPDCLDWSQAIDLVGRALAG